MIVGNGHQNGPTIFVSRPVDKNGTPVKQAYKVYTQETPSLIWTIQHSFGRLPTVSVLDTDGNVVVANINVSLNTVVVSFGQPMAGTAVLA